MKVTELLARTDSPPISYEIIPPLRGSSVQQVFDTVEQLLPFEPPFIDVTSHAAEAYYEELPDGTVRRYSKRKRPGTIGLCAAIQHRFRVEAIPHPVRDRARIADRRDEPGLLPRGASQRRPH